jgi:hypothetical protein
MANDQGGQPVLSESSIANALVTILRGRAHTIAWRHLNASSFVALCRAHAVTPVVERELRDTRAPAAFRDPLRHDAERLAASMLGLSEATLETTAALADAGILAVAFKGPTLAHRLYGTMTLRSSADVDLLLRPSSVRAACDVLHTIGFERKDPREITRSLLEHGNEVVCVRPTDGQIVELQWAVAPAYFGFNIDVQAMLGRSTLAPFASGQTRFLELEDETLLLLAHGGKHLWERLAWINDIAHIAVTDSLDWSRVGEAAAASRMRLHASVGIRLAFQLADSADASPGAVSLATADRRAEQLARSVWARTLLRDPKTSEVPLRLLDIRLRDNAADAARVIARLAFTPNERDQLRAHTSAREVHLLARAFRLGRKYFRPFAWSRKRIAQWRNAPAPSFFPR